MMRVICAAVLSRGAQNEASLEQGRRFLMDNRLSTMSVLKKSAGLSTGSAASEESILSLAESFMTLINLTGFLDVSTQSLPIYHKADIFLERGRSNQKKTTHSVLYLNRV